MQPNSETYTEPPETAPDLADISDEPAAAGRPVRQRPQSDLLALLALLIIAVAFTVGDALLAFPLLTAPAVYLGWWLCSRRWDSRVSQAVEIISSSNAKSGAGQAAIDEIISAHFASTAELQHQLALTNDELEVLTKSCEVLTENLAAAIVIRDCNEKIAYCSPYTEVLTGYSVDEIYNSEDDFFCGIIHESDQQKYRRAVKVSSFGEAFQFRYRFFHKTGLEMWAETRTVPILDEAGEVSSSLSITLDVTGLIRHQQQIEEKNRDLEDFSYMISHDLKAPIFTIKGMVNILEEDYKGQLDTEFDESIGHICKAAQRLEELVKSVLEYSKISTLEMIEEEVDLNSVLTDISNEYHQQFEEAGAGLQVSDNLPSVIGDKLKVYQIFSNLIGNALKYRDKKRTLLIKVFQNEAMQDRFAEICVADNGLGIPENRLDDIFRPFQRAHSKEIEGSGIGLACVKRLLEKLDGSISVESKEGAGSNFMVRLPKAAGSLMDIK